MKHCILVKFKEEYKNKINEYLPDIKNIFDKTKEIEGINDVEYILNCIDRDNRYDLLIRIDMKKESLETYDHCDSHKLWKDKYGSYLEKKAIFDYE